ncbi:hypothetical protein MCHI_001887 [Candidatus Magnetoovum chiemensis]|nr:hypothetical protein MCHI_001887 [Candidatus Magnetoovum chiemensis]
MAYANGYEHVIDGSNADDIKDYRPGFKAKELFNVKSPLMDLGFTKDEIRMLSKQKGLRTWNKPSSPCLSSRLPYNEKITPKALEMVEQAEDVLKKLGFADVRVRKQDNCARIEINDLDINKLLDNETRTFIVTKLRQIGFLFITLDLEGFRSGKLNRSLF